MKHESETWVMTTETLNSLWHTKWHDPLDLLHQHEKQSLLRLTSCKAWQSGYRCDTLHNWDLGGL